MTADAGEKQARANRALRKRSASPNGGSASSRAGSPPSKKRLRAIAPEPCGSGLGTLNRVPGELLGLVLDNVVDLPDLRSLMYASRACFALAAPRLWKSIWFVDEAFDVEALHRMTQSLWVLRHRDYARWVRDLNLLALDDDEDVDQYGGFTRHEAVLLATENVTRLALKRNSSALLSVCQGYAESGLLDHSNESETGNVAARRFLLPHLRELVIYAVGNVRTCRLAAPFRALALAGAAGGPRATLNVLNLNLTTGINRDAIQDLDELRQLGDEAQKGVLPAMQGLHHLSVTADTAEALRMAMNVFGVPMVHEAASSKLAVPLRELSLLLNPSYGQSTAGPGNPAQGYALQDLVGKLAQLPLRVLRLGKVPISSEMLAAWGCFPDQCSEMWRKLQDFTLLWPEFDSLASWKQLLRGARNLCAFRIRGQVVAPTLPLGPNDIAYNGLEQASAEFISMGAVGRAWTAVLTALDRDFHLEGLHFLDLKIGEGSDDQPGIRALGKVLRRCKVLTRLHITIVVAPVAELIEEITAAIPSSVYELRIAIPNWRIQFSKADGTSVATRTHSSNGEEMHPPETHALRAVQTISPKRPKKEGATLSLFDATHEGYVTLQGAALKDFTSGRYTLHAHPRWIA